jgi:hypothetical protein
MGHAATSAVISTAEPGTEGGVEEEVFQSKELMSMVVSLSDMSITDLSRFALVCRCVFCFISPVDHISAIINDLNILYLLY